MQAAWQYPFIFSDEPKYRFRRHLAFWIFWWLFQGIIYSMAPMPRSVPYLLQLQLSVLQSIIYLPAHIFLSCTLMYFVVPKYLLKQKYLLTALFVVILFIVTAVMSAALSLTIIAYIEEHCLLLNYARNRSNETRIFLSLMAGLRGGITIGGIAASIKLMKHWYVKEQRNLQLQKENAEARLQLLKAQVHPHFLFNTLNNIYAHTQNTAPVASQLVMGLSDMLRFMLYECNQPLVPLLKELKLIQDYITLEQIRYDEQQLDVHIDYPQNTGNLGIAPLLLLPLVENCFKHGTSHMIEQPWLTLQVTLEENKIYVKLMNGKPDEAPENNNAGIGIDNVRKRLNLLYPNKHELIITNEPDVFIVNLWLQLTPLPSVKKETGTFMLSYHE